MHCRELVELAAIIAVRGPAPIADRPTAADALEEYRSASQLRIESWKSVLEQRQSWAQRRPFLEEILVTEVLTRVWAGAACAGADRLFSIACDAYDAHLSAR